jgi:hypothetical protein
MSKGGSDVMTFHITTDIKDDREVLLNLPPEVPIGKAELVVSVEPVDATPAGMPDWLEVQAHRDTGNEDRYPLRGSVLRYDEPTEPVAENEWEALR